MKYQVGDIVTDYWSDRSIYGIYEILETNVGVLKDRYKIKIIKNSEGHEEGVSSYDIESLDGESELNTLYMKQKVFKKELELILKNNE